MLGSSLLIAASWRLILLYIFSTWLVLNSVITNSGEGKNRKFGEEEGEDERERFEAHR